MYYLNTIKAIHGFYSMQGVCSVAYVALKSSKALDQVFSLTSFSPINDRKEREITGVPSL